MKKILLFLFTTAFALTALNSLVAIWANGVNYLSVGVPPVLFEGTLATVFGILTWKA